MIQRILFVADAPRGSLSRVLEPRGFVLSATLDLERAIELMTESPIDLVVVNLDETEEGLDFIKRIRSLQTLRASTILALGNWGTGKASLALAQGADAYEPTPVDATRLVEAFDRLLNKRAAVAGMSE